MRLGQLARQLSISTDKIVSFLGSRDIAVDSHNNARIDPAYVDLVLLEFAPGNDTLRQEVIQTQDTPETESAEGNPTTTEATPIIPDLIKAPKVELPGLRVLGKIELPEKKKPDVPKEEDKEAPKESQRPAFVSRSPRRNAPPRDRKNPVALAREQEESEKRRKLDEAREEEKQRKAAYYQKRLKPQPPTKSVRLFREETEEMPKLPAERPKTFWGRFMRWLND